jgi:hypothetical protein
MKIKKEINLHVVRIHDDDCDWNTRLKLWEVEFKGDEWNEMKWNNEITIMQHFSPHKGTVPFHCETNLWCTSYTGFAFTVLAALLTKLQLQDATETRPTGVSGRGEVVLCLNIGPLRCIWDAEVTFRAFCNAAQGRGEWSPSRSCQFAREDRSRGTRWTKGWVDPRAFGCGVLPTNRNPVVQPIAGNSTVWI